MPERDLIIQKVAGLEPSTFEERLNPEQVWTGEEKGTKFELTRSAGEILGVEVDILQLIVRGRQTGKEKIAQDFVDALGDPSRKLILRALGNAIYMSWETPNQG